MESSKAKRGKHPRDEASFLSNLFYLWTIGVFKIDHKQKLKSDDVWQPCETHKSEVLGDRLEKQWDAEVFKKSTQSKIPSLFVVLVKTFWPEVLFLGVIHVCQQLLDILIRPRLLKVMLSYFRETDGATIETVVYSAVGLVLATSLNYILINLFTMSAFTSGMKMRASCISLVFRKALRLSKTAMDGISPGQVVNLVSNDVSRFDLILITFHYMWSSPIITVIVTYFLWQEVGVASMAGIVTILIVVPILIYSSFLTSRYRLQTAYKTDERIRLTDESLAGIQIIKLYAWEKRFIAVLEAARKLEIGIIRKTSYLRGIYMTFNLFTTRMALFCTLITYVYSGNSLTSESVFVVQAYFAIISFSLTSLFVRGFAEIAEAAVSVGRLQTYMLNEEVPIPENFVHADPKSDMAVHLHDVCASWVEGSSHNTLNQINLKVSKSQLVGIIGGVGSGKSSLLSILIREIKVISGKVSIAGGVSYACQEPWVFNGTVRQNILFGLPYNKKRYNQVVKVCCLERDLELFANGDQTLVGERGTSLSGGQKARINLARSVYKEADIYIFDDPLSAVDTHVGKHLFQDCFREFLKGKTVVLATHQIQFVKKVDYVVILQNGCISQQGTVEELYSRGIDFTHIRRTSSTLDTIKVSAPSKLERAISIMSSRSGVADDNISLMGSSIDGEEEDEIKLHEEPKQETIPKYTNSVFWGYFKHGGSAFTFFIIIFLFLFAQFCASGSDNWVAQWTTWEERNNTSNPPLGRTTSVIIYGSLIGTLLITGLLRGFVFYTICMRSSLRIHSGMVTGIITAALSFFSNNSSGGILNRFSKDLGSVDEILPKSLLDCGQIFGQVLGSIVNTMTVSPWLIIPAIAFTSICYGIREYCIKTCKNLKRLENFNRSPVFNHLNTTMQGLTTIRAHESQDYLIKNFDLLQDVHTACNYTYLATQQGLSFCLDWVSLTYLTAIISFLIFVDVGFSGAQVGLAITQIMSMSGLLQWGLRMSSEVITQMTSTERILGLTLIEPEEATLREKPLVKRIEPKGWPQRGVIEFKNVSYRYELNKEPVIRDLTFSISSGEFVGIVGRTGAGKSSLIGALFRLAHIQGEIFIDGLETSQMSFTFLRSKLAIIPQSPVLFSGTLRKNLDPFNEYTDDILWGALEHVDLKDVVKEGLSTKISEGGSNMSVGQRQLVCLARAIVRNSKVLVMDEATANIDLETDSLIQKTIRRCFKGHTVLTIAHRLNTVMDYDRILVMDAGRMVEFDCPHILMQKSSGYLYSLVKETGKEMTAELMKLAEEHYMKSQKAVLGKDD